MDPRIWVRDLNKESACNSGDLGSILGSERSPEWQPTPVSLPGKSHGQRGLEGCSPWGRKESGTTELLTQQSRSKVLKLRALYNFMERLQGFNNSLNCYETLVGTIS